MRRWGWCILTRIRIYLTAILMASATPTGTPFRRAIEEGLLDPKRVVQIGIRGTMYDGEDIKWGRAQGVTIITMDACIGTGARCCDGRSPPNCRRQTHLCQFLILIA